MTLRNKKLVIGVMILLAYIGLGVFGLFRFSHNMTEAPMINCPYTQNGSSVCESSLDHINDWHQFSNITSATLFIFTLIIFGIFLYFYNQRNFLSQKQYFYQWKYYLYSKKLFIFPNRIIKWLSLLENSPAFSYVRHS
ncbi:MAG: hypothetical protein Q8L01_02475 [Candidatus Woesebacteria bacterium]|nr:hypothetical protein [Candidatus Woesebacteria bacterium]